MQASGSRCGTGKTGIKVASSGKRNEKDGPPGRPVSVTVRLVEHELALVGLDAKSGDVAASLPYGDRRRLEIARALALRPKILLLDEPAAGMNLAEKGDLTTFIRDLRDRFNLTVLIIEHHVPLVMGLCDRLAVLNFGRLICQGTPETVRGDQCVIDAYLGDTHATSRS